MSDRVVAKLKELGHELPHPPAPVGAYVSVKQIGNLVVTSGQLPFVGKMLTFKGKVGAALQTEEAQFAALHAVLNALAHIREHLGSLERVRQVLRLEGYINSAAGFQEQPRVLNRASELLGRLFGEAGRHTRIAVGVAELPMDAAVEVALWVEAEPERTPDSNSA